MHSETVPGDDTAPEPKVGNHQPLWFAGALSLIWLATAIWLGLSAENQHTLWPPSNLTANEWGDFLAGVFAPMAFFWLVATVWIQSSELREQRKELALTRMEFQYTRTVLKAQAEEAKRQAEFIGQQTEMLRQRDNGEAFDNWVSLLASRLRMYDHAWTFDCPEQNTSLRMRKNDYSVDGDQDLIISARTQLRERIRAMEQKNKSLQNGTAGYPQDFMLIFDAVRECRKLARVLPASGRAKAEALELDRFWRDLHAIYKSCIEPHGLLIASR